MPSPSDVPVSKVSGTAVHGDTFKSAMGLSSSSSHFPVLDLTTNKMMYSRFTVLAMIMTLLTLLVNAAPVADSLVEATHKRDVVGSHQWIAQHAQSAATVPEQAAGKK